MAVRPPPTSRTWSSRLELQYTAAEYDAAALDAALVNALEQARAGFVDPGAMRMHRDPRRAAR